MNTHHGDLWGLNGRCPKWPLKKKKPQTMGHGPQWPLKKEKHKQWDMALKQSWGRSLNGLDFIPPLCLSWLF